VRSNRGTGGQLDQLAKTSEIVGAQLFNKVAGHKRTRNQLENVSANLPDNDLAPPAGSKRQRKSKEVASLFLFSSTTGTHDSCRIELLAIPAQTLGVQCIQIPH
jgi:hypothetical protein